MTLSNDAELRSRPLPACLTQTLTTGRIGSRSLVVRLKRNWI
jgi:hypothetical protein